MQRVARLVVPVVPVLLLGACMDAPNAVVAPNEAVLSAVPEAPLMAVQAEAGAPVPGQYIVVMKPARGARAASAAAAVGVASGKVKRTFHAALDGFSASLSDAEAAALARDPNVALVERDQVFTISTTQSPATWGLDRIDQRARPLSNSYTYTRTGAGVRAYIIDTGIRFSHGEFGGRATSGFDAVDGGAADDCNGHGTHVSGTVGGATYGVAKGVSLVGVRVLDCAGSGTTSGVIAGVDWVTANHVKPAVANMSLGGGASAALDQAVANSIAAGVTYAIAAGNSNARACNYSPARVATAITVGATTSTDARASYSNWGSCLDLFAPGSSITSSWYTSNTATNTISGTSMATPHVAGVAALYLQGNPGATPATVRNALVANATSGVVGNARTGSPNLLLFTNY
ncbi:MAG: S8 family peptidase [Gemmatimonadaceae bacterium]